MTNHKDPLVSVRLITFNHEAFIKDALDGIFMQKTSFPIEVVIGDDFSTDTTLEIIKAYKSTAQIQLKILDRPKGGDYHVNRKQQGRLYNFKDCINHCSGTYIALLDGDDYWEDPTKLQRQIDFLEKHPEVAISFHNMCLVNEHKEVVDVDFLKTKKLKWTPIELVGGAILPTSSVVFRNGLEVPQNFTKAKNGDTFLFSLLAAQGSAHMEPMLREYYRVHQGGVYSLKPLKIKKQLSYTTYRQLKKVVSKPFVPVVNRTLASISWAICKVSQSLTEKLRYGSLTIWYGCLYVLSAYFKLNV